MDEKMIMTYLVTDLFCIIIALTMSASFNEDFGSGFEVKSLRKSVYSYCGFLEAGLIWLLMENRCLPMVVWVVWLANMCSLFLLIAISYYWFLFAVSRVNKKIIANKYALIISEIPMLVAGLMCLSTPITGWVFSVSPDGVYSRGPMLIFFSSLGFVYNALVFAIALMSTLKENQKEIRKTYLTISLYIVFPLAASILQLLISGTPILAPAILTGYFLVFNTIRSSQIYNDALTGLNNRRSIISYLNECLQNTYEKSPIVLYMLDFNSFKSINDTYGHVEGDRALKMLASTLSKVAVNTSSFAARYGGDEFMIVTRDSDRIAMLQLVNMVHRDLAEQSYSENLPYKLTVSIGHAIAYDKTTSVEELIDRADQALYIEKSKFYQTN